MDSHNTDSLDSHSSADVSDHSSGDRMSERLSESASRVQDEVKHQAETLKQDAKDRSKAFIEDKKNIAAAELTDVAGALRASADSLRENEHDQAGHYVKLAADGLAHFAHLIRQRDVGRLARDTEQLARRQPAVFLGGTIAAGFLLSRFLKASARREDPDGAQAPRSRRDSASSTADSEAYANRAPKSER